MLGICGSKVSDPCFPSKHCFCRSRAGVPGPEWGLNNWGSLGSGKCHPLNIVRSLPSFQAAGFFFLEDCAPGKLPENYRWPFDTWSSQVKDIPHVLSLVKASPRLEGAPGLIPASKGPDEKMVEFVGFRLLRLPLSRCQRPHLRQVHTKLPGSPGLSIGNQRRREILGHRRQRRCQGTIQICSGGFSEQFLPSSDAAAGPPSVGFRGLGTSRWTIADSPRTV
jgi:hypothetical protein